MCSSWYNNWVTWQHARCNKKKKFTPFTSFIYSTTHCLSNNIVSNSTYAVSNGRSLTNHELEKTYKKVVVDWFHVLSMHLPEKTGQNNTTALATIASVWAFRFCQRRGISSLAEWQFLKNHSATWSVGKYGIYYISLHFCMELKDCIYITAHKNGTARLLTSCCSIQPTKLSMSDAPGIFSPPISRGQ